MLTTKIVKLVFILLSFCSTKFVFSCNYNIPKLSLPPPPKDYKHSVSEKIEDKILNSRNTFLEWFWTMQYKIEDNNILKKIQPITKNNEESLLKEILAKLKKQHPLLVKKLEIELNNSFFQERTIIAKSRYCTLAIQDYLKNIRCLPKKKFPQLLCVDNKVIQTEVKQLKQELRMILFLLKALLPEKTLSEELEEESSATDFFGLF